nr:MAG TPA: hypothetical protein [Caudoviricetes sp.]
MRRILVSIHAPARGATERVVERGVVVAVSIHAPARGATPAPSRACPAPTCFNPRAREGRDFPRCHLPFSSFVSIHAPARGATTATPAGRRRARFQSTRPRGARRLTFYGNDGRTVFQSTRPRGARPDESPHGIGVIPFQSTRPRGARPLVSVLCLACERFNPRAREGRDVEKASTPPDLNSFQSTRPRGARLHQAQLPS